VAIYVALGLAVDLIVPRIPWKIEKNLESLFLKNYISIEKTSARENLQQLLDNISNELPSHNISYKVHLIEDPQANAIALPGGNIIVYSGILNDLGSENELAFVMSHELGHFSNRDHLRGLGRFLVLWTLSTAIIGHDNFVTQFLAGSLVNVEMKFSQRQETRADLFAIDLLNKRYGHVGGADSFFKKIREKEKRGHLSYYFASHPHPNERIEAMEEYVRKKGYRKEATIPLSDRFLVGSQ
jgi:predicted Zn-dependent protease